jgi:hypothetical protein
MSTQEPWLAKERDIQDIDTLLRLALDEPALSASHRGFDRSGSPHRSCHAITVRLVPIAQEPAPVTRTRLFDDRFKRALPTGTYAVIWSWGRFNFTGS